MAAGLSAPPVLSTPDEQLLEVPAASISHSQLSDDALRTRYEVERTAREILKGGWNRVALQFPDHMLVDVPRVVQALDAELKDGVPSPVEDTESDFQNKPEPEKKRRRIYVLADTSYSACCVDEVAAEHAEADVVVHYGRTCLSPTSRLPVVYVYTHNTLDLSAALQAFEGEFPERDSKVVIMADLTYQNHMEEFTQGLREKGYSRILKTEVIRDPGGLIPNRRTEGESLDEASLKEHALFHISDPPTALLLALHSRFASLHVLAMPSSTIENPTSRTAALLRRRFARVLSLASAGVIGILVNTLSVSNYLGSVETLRKRIAAAGKKSYTVVVGKLNPAKLANFAEIEGWVVVGCWESALVEDESGQYWRPTVTPFELEVAMKDESSRLWDGEWWAGIEKLKLDDDGGGRWTTKEGENAAQADEDLDGDESLPPEFDLRTGKLVSHSRPMRLASGNPEGPATEVSPDGVEAGSRSSTALLRRNVGDVVAINGVASPGAQFLRSGRTWQGLGTDFDGREGAGGGESTVVEEGRSGIARGYQVGSGERH